LINKLRHFQDLGHHVMFLIGDFTGLIGDPTGKKRYPSPRCPGNKLSRTRRPIKNRSSKSLIRKKLKSVLTRHGLTPWVRRGMIKLAAQHTVARMLERDDFSKRYAGGLPIAIHEFLYPLCQGYDSVAMRADVELGGTDQKFNLLVGRELQKHYGQQPQCVLTMPLLEGLDGVNKMSKSLGNYIGINEAPREIFGKVMSISDNLMWRYYDLLSFRDLAEIARFKQDIGEGRNPRDIKVLLAQELVERFHSRIAAEDALNEFEARFRQGVLPDDMPELTVSSNGVPIPVVNVLKLAGLTASTSEALRMLAQGAIRANGEKVSDKGLAFAPGESVVLQVGKRKFAKVQIA
jgi:tyrosyl-tRNA synthetase